jgi:hypothetical protein
MDPGKAPRIVDVHVPLHGPHFRPSLEAILAMTHEEPGVDTARAGRRSSMRAVSSGV